jgi:hypothetical protein
MANRPAPCTSLKTLTLVNALADVQADAANAEWLSTQFHLVAFAEGFGGWCCPGTDGATLAFDVTVEDLIHELQDIAAKVTREGYEADFTAFTAFRLLAAKWDLECFTGDIFSAE